jgi:hypothetical protein
MSNNSTPPPPPYRVQLRRTKGWRKPANTVVVARPSKWGNPWTVDMYRIDYPPSSDSELRRMAVSDYRGWLDGRWDLDADWPQRDRPDVRELRGKNLACWCPLGEPCHADVLLELANREVTS